MGVHMGCALEVCIGGVNRRCAEEVCRGAVNRCEWVISSK